MNKDTKQLLKENKMNVFGKPSMERMFSSTRAIDMIEAAHIRIGPVIRGEKCIWSGGAVFYNERIGCSYLPESRILWDDDLLILIQKIYDLEYYEGLPWVVKKKKIPVKSGGGFCMSIPLLSKYSCIGYGDSEEEAMNNLYYSLTDVLKYCIEKFITVPMPPIDKTNYNIDCDKSLSCPVCKADWRGEKIPRKNKKHYGGIEYYSRLVGVEVIGRGDRVDHWLCPDCGSRWDRSGKIVSMGAYGN